MWLELILGILILAILWKALAKPKGYPPGYWGLPLIGYIPLNGKNLVENILDLYERNGRDPVICWRMGTKLVVFVFDHEISREALVGKDFVDRPRLRTLVINGDSNLGVVLGNGTGWQNTRRFVINHLRDLGMGKSSLVPIIQHEAVELVKDFKSRAGKPTECPKSIDVAPLNVIWQMVASKRHELDDENLKEFYSLLKKYRDEYNTVMILDMMPWIKTHLPKFVSYWFMRQGRVNEIKNKMKELIMRDIRAHEEKLDADAEPKDFIDAYLLEIKKTENDPNSTFTVDDMIATISDLFSTGTETVSLTFVWLILYAIKFPDVQKKIQEEIDNALPNGSIPSIEDKSRLPFTEAFINEVARHSSFIKLGVKHMATRDTHLGGYKIPKGNEFALENPWQKWNF